MLITRYCLRLSLHVLLVGTFDIIRESYSAMIAVFACTFLNFATFRALYLAVLDFNFYAHIIGFICLHISLLFPDPLADSSAVCAWLGEYVFRFR